MDQPLPLFPLGTVLFPGLVLPLHVFEERYRLLVRELVELPEGRPRRFGVVAIRKGWEVGTAGVQALHDHGCTALVRRVEGYADGRFDIVTVGAERFRLEELDESRPYLRGRVEVLPELLGGSAEAAVLAGAVRRAFTGYLRAIGEAQGSEITVPSLPDDALLLSYLVAATVLVDLAVRQSLLAEPDGVARLRAELSLIKRETTMLRRLPAAPAPPGTWVPASPN